ncbi:leukotriene B4 receptor 1-like isoform X1 [Sinocyclocheilus anshuiensis]|uniref:leukotriene B4 receptor 1-like isoform X1 n=1 Tax=Sinocyclocheilus anshuiensis TaxID=1608454 RepID=UPI0007BAA395|nr:PREDICTED: leukotriene B4 receptor 1-like isoform X1 [Sinocyclocheilus anshuiensis]
MGSDNGTSSLENVTNSNSIVSNNISVTFGALILSIVFLLGVPGNLFIIWSILARARKRSVTTLLILNLACADGCLMCLTIFFIIYLAKQNWIFGTVMCKLLFYLCNTNMYASIMIITLMSLHRLVAVMWPIYLTACTRRRTVLLVLGGLWIVVFLLALPALIFRRTEKNYNGKERTVCATHHQHGVFQYTLETVVGFLVPYVIIVSSYGCILRRLRQTMFKRRIQSENLIQAIIVTFCIFWLPYHCINIVQVAAALTSDGSLKKRRVEDFKVWSTDISPTEQNHCDHFLCLSPDWITSGSPAVWLRPLWLLSVVVPILSSTPLLDAPTSKLTAWHSWPDSLRALSWTMVHREAVRTEMSSSSKPHWSTDRKMNLGQ